MGFPSVDKVSPDHYIYGPHRLSFNLSVLDNHLNFHLSEDQPDGLQTDKSASSHEVSKLEGLFKKIGRSTNDKLFVNEFVFDSQVPLSDLKWIETDQNCADLIHKQAPAAFEKYKDKIKIISN